jgi:ABC-type multidrug transport system fused ATPase/permease subunit
LGSRAHSSRTRLFFSIDEATSTLDVESEEAVRVALDRLMQSRTVIAIAHRLASHRSFDRIIVLQSGTIREDGHPHALMTRPGRSTAAESNASSRGWSGGAA